MLTLLAKAVDILASCKFQVLTVQDFPFKISPNKIFYQGTVSSCLTLDSEVKGVLKHMIP